MKRKLTALVLIVALVLTFGGCAEFSQVAGDALASAQQQLEQKIQAALDQYKVDIVELKTAVGKLNDEGSDWQFFCAILVKAEKETMVSNCTQALEKVFDQTGSQLQTQSNVEHPLLKHKSITFSHSDFSDGTYYLVYGYLPDMSLQLPDWTLPQIGPKK